MKATRPVWGGAVRALHWGLVVSVALSAAGLVWWPTLHRPAGYVALAIVIARTGWGFAGSGYARFAQFVRGPRATLRYALQWLRSREPRYIGHNPLGAYMVLALIGCIASLAFTGWLYTTDAFFGSEAVEDLHRTLAWTLLALVVVHVGGVLHASFRHRENLVASMLSGRKRDASETDVR